MILKSKRILSVISLITAFTFVLFPVTPAMADPLEIETLEADSAVIEADAPVEEAVNTVEPEAVGGEELPPTIAEMDAIVITTAVEEEPAPAAAPDSNETTAQTADAEAVDQTGEAGTEEDIEDDSEVLFAELNFGADPDAEVPAGDVTVFTATEEAAADDSAAEPPVLSEANRQWLVDVLETGGDPILLLERHPEFLQAFLVGAIALVGTEKAVSYGKILDDLRKAGKVQELLLKIIFDQIDGNDGLWSTYKNSIPKDIFKAQGIADLTVYAKLSDLMAAVRAKIRTLTGKDKYAAYQAVGRFLVEFKKLILDYTREQPDVQGALNDGEQKKKLCGNCVASTAFDAIMTAAFEVPFIAFSVSTPGKNGKVEGHRAGYIPMGKDSENKDLGYFIDQTIGIEKRLDDVLKATKKFQLKSGLSASPVYLPNTMNVIGGGTDTQAAVLIIAAEAAAKQALRRQQTAGKDLKELWAVVDYLEEAERIFPGMPFSAMNGGSVPYLKRDGDPAKTVKEHLARLLVSMARFNYFKQPTRDYGQAAALLKKAIDLNVLPADYDTGVRRPLPDGSLKKFNPQELYDDIVNKRLGGSATNVPAVKREKSKVPPPPKLEIGEDATTPAVPQAEDDGDDKPEAITIDKLELANPAKGNHREITHFVIRPGKFLVYYKGRSSPSFLTSKSYAKLNSKGFFLYVTIDGKAEKIMAIKHFGKDGGFGVFVEGQNPATDTPKYQAYFNSIKAGKTYPPRGKWLPVNGTEGNTTSQLDGTTDDTTVNVAYVDDGPLMPLIEEDELLFEGDYEVSSNFLVSTDENGEEKLQMEVMVYDYYTDEIQWVVVDIDLGLDPAEWTVSAYDWETGELYPASLGDTYAYQSLIEETFYMLLGNPLYV